MEVMGNYNTRVIDPNTGKVIKQGTAVTRFFRALLTFSFYSVLVFAITLGSLSFVFSVNPVEGTSMMQTLNANSRVIIDGEVVNYRYIEDQVVINKMQKPKIGDIFVIENQTARDLEWHIKRLIAVAGDTIHLERKDGQYYVYRNGEQLIEPYLDEEDGWGIMDGSNYDLFYAFQTGSRTASGFEWQKYFENGKLVVPSGYIFYLGDNRQTSSDSIELGPQPESKVVGTVVQVIP
ncbi:MAG: signal peptidase I, partial [Firmicutes bacterium]|nr:signal peptidase I [Bacillota bacterium]